MKDLMMKGKIIFSNLIFCLVLFAESEFNLKGQMIGASNISYNKNDYILNGYLQYLPMAEYSEYLGNLNYSVDVAGNFITNFESDPDAKLYRLKFSISNDQNEFRVGLQKLNFGPAQILRSLQWFDTMSPTDLLKLTNGVYGALYRHYFLNNNNIWFWSLYGNNDPKGFEMYKTKENTFEFGGRSQIMILNGEVGLTFHHRQLYFDTEQKLAFDGRWDYIIGSWFEAVAIHNENMNMAMLTLGSDYTFGIGNGLYVVNEHLMTHSDFNGSTKIEIPQVSSIMVVYPFSLFDNFNSITYYSWETKELSQFIGWQRTYDNFIFNLNLFHFPKNNSSIQNMSGYGIEFKIIYNH